MLSPLILPFLVLFFGFGYLVCRYLLLYVYVAPFESGGAFWPMVFSRMCAALIFSHITLIGTRSLPATFVRCHSHTALCAARQVCSV